MTESQRLIASAFGLASSLAFVSYSEGEEQDKSVVAGALLDGVGLMEIVSSFDPVLEGLWNTVKRRQGSCEGHCFKVLILHRFVPIVGGVNV